MTASTKLWVAVAAVCVSTVVCASKNDAAPSLTAHDQDIFAQNMLSFLGASRPVASKAQRFENVTAPSGTKENFLVTQVTKEIRQLKQSLPRNPKARLSAKQASQMRTIYRHMKQLAKSTSNKRQSRILIEALSIFAGAKIGSMMATECRNWLDKLSNLAVSINYGRPTQQVGYYQPYYSPGYVQPVTQYYGAPCNDNTYPTCSATSGTPCNNNGLPACYFNWPLCNSNVYPVCSTTSGTPCNNNGLPYCVDVGVPCNSNNLGYCVNGPAPCNDNNWPFCPGFTGPTVG